MACKGGSLGRGRVRYFEGFQSCFHFCSQLPSPTGCEEQTSPTYTTLPSVPLPYYGGLRTYEPMHQNKLSFLDISPVRYPVFVIRTNGHLEKRTRGPSQEAQAGDSNRRQRQRLCFSGLHEAWGNVAPLRTRDWMGQK